jgi:hypothetical protein
MWFINNAETFRAQKFSAPNKLNTRYWQYQANCWPWPSSGPPAQDVSGGSEALQVEVMMGKSSNGMGECVYCHVWLPEIIVCFGWEKTTTENPRNADLFRMTVGIVFDQHLCWRLTPRGWKLRRSCKDKSFVGPRHWSQNAKKFWNLKLIHQYRNQTEVLRQQFYHNFNWASPLCRQGGRFHHRGPRTEASNNIR